MSETSGNADQIAFWNSRGGQTWARLQDRLDAVLEPVLTAALEAADPRPGERVIDIGCGCGATLLALARRVGASGRVTGLDVSEPMSARARERLAEAGLTNAQVVLGDASTHGLPAGGADLLFSRFGVMFFKDPVAAFGRLRGALRPGARMLCAAWRTLHDNAWMRVPLEAAMPLLPPQPPADPLAPGPYAFADQDRTRTMLLDAGWRQPALARHDIGLCLAPAGDVAAAADLMSAIGPLSRILADMNPEDRLPVRQAVMDALQRHDTPAGVILTGSIWLMSARA
jgi:SAM-dependent methyltransferase